MIIEIYDMRPELLHCGHPLGSSTAVCWDVMQRSPKKEKRKFLSGERCMTFKITAVEETIQIL